MTLMRTISTAATAAALTLLVGCGSMGGLGSILGGGDPNSGYPSSGSQSTRIQGTVNNVDTRNQRIDVSVYSNSGQGGQRNATIYYDNRTRVSYRNQSGSPSQLERGDQIDVTLYNNGNNQALADTITVTQSISDNNGNYPNNNGNYPNNNPNYPNTPNNNYPNSYPSNGQTNSVQGTVSRVDTQRQRIDMSVNYINGLRNSQSSYSVYYDNRTRVLYQNRTHQPSDLEQGDQIEVSLYNGSNGQALADTITVTRNVRQ